MSCETDLSAINTNTLATKEKVTSLETEIKKITVADSTGLNVFEQILKELKKLNTAITGG